MLDTSRKVSDCLLVGRRDPESAGGENSGVIVGKVLIVTTGRAGRRTGIGVY